MSCRHDFTWASTSSSAAQRCLDMYHCYSCGGVYCDSCSQHEKAMPELAMVTPVRVCDACFFAPSEGTKKPPPDFDLIPSKFAD